MKLIDLFEEKLIDIEPSNIKIENGKMILNQFPNKVGNFNCSGLENLTSLENSLTQVVNSFNCRKTAITSLKGSPKLVNFAFFCEETKITSLEYAPLKCNEFFCEGNDIKNLQGIGKKYLKECKTIGLPDSIESNILGLCLVNKLKYIDVSDWWVKINVGPLYEALEIVKKHLGTDGEECMEELIQNGYKDYAKF